MSLGHFIATELQQNDLRDLFLIGAFVVDL